MLVPPNVLHYCWAFDSWTLPPTYLFSIHNQSCYYRPLWHPISLSSLDSFPLLWSLRDHDVAGRCNRFFPGFQQQLSCWSPLSPSFAPLFFSFLIKAFRIFNFCVSLLSLSRLITCTVKKESNNGTKTDLNISTVEVLWSIWVLVSSSILAD